MKNVKAVYFLILLPLFLSCGAKPVTADLEVKSPDTLPIYTYLDNMGNTYIIRPGKLEYTPVSEENSIDGIDDQGYHTMINISVNAFNKIKAIIEQERARKQNELTDRDPALPVPEVTKRDAAETVTTTLDLEAVRQLNFILEPYLEDQ
ncbi:hypothetical protein ACH3O9_09050 [Leeuwenhoekiella sp. A16]|uniref:hypothetical protein n=1 Tax=unclassified Leeuwenhoekiella TaxID=2615029 RepID=UPI003A803A21